MVTKCFIATSFVVSAALASPAWAFQEPGSSFKNSQNVGDASPVGQTQTGATNQQPTGGLASAMANFMVRTGLVVGPDAEGRLIVKHIRPESDAGRLGIQPGDIVTSVNGVEAKTFWVLENYLTAYPRQTAFDVGLRRGGHAFYQPMGRQLSLIGMTIFPDAADRPYVYSVEPKSPAARAGVQRGDVIIAVADRTTDTMTRLMNFATLFVRSLKEGQGVRFRLVRNGKPLTLSVSRPKDSELEPLTPPEKRIIDRQGGALTTATQELVRPMAPSAARPPEDLTSVVAVLYGPSQNATVNATRGTVGYVMVQITVPPPQPGTAIAVPLSNSSIQPSGSIINPANPSTVPNLGRPRTVPPLITKNVHATLSAQLSGLPEGRYALVLGQYADCADLVGISLERADARLGTIQVHSNGSGSLQNAPIAYAPQDLQARVVIVFAAAVPGPGNLAAPPATATTGSPISTGIWGCGIFHLANPRGPMPAQHPGSAPVPARPPVKAPPIAGPTAAVAPTASPTPAQPQ